ncbi:multiple epidermal growth factor-like domains protein 8 isoform X2 [Leucoraja erinacea]|uniref:multiple epidermal growth factor-like domains protein 8 isoform X2 n=1 Tax=Leucoraja erinaceus TaxID=7782 RepID=UPI002457D617|nr:multiple epidermal growth factor-like domains protein 8 isoform X2 [Leucoraja erinacea]
MQDSEQAVCRPVCEQGCMNGTCVEPNQCRCHFGWVGTDCSLLCNCNQHSECAGVTQRDHCLQCVHNTQGDQCDQCRPLFVGSALEGGSCRPCSSFCNNNSHVCITKDQYVKWLLQPDSHPLQPDQISSWVMEGPLEETALCVQCQNHSSGERCESCLDG